MNKKLYLSIFIAAVCAFTLISPANAMVDCYDYGYGHGHGPTHGWNGQPIRLDYSMGGPNILINETNRIDSHGNFFKGLQRFRLFYI